MSEKGNDTSGPIAHSSDDGRVHLLDEHLTETSRLAAGFASYFRSSGWAALAGLWHDLGKYSPAFQNKILSSLPDMVDHSTAGGIHAVKQLGGPGRVLAYVIAGHHAGLPDWLSETSGAGGLLSRLEKEGLYGDAFSGNPPMEILNLDRPSERPRPGTDLSASTWIRMLYSCVVDADFLDTERFISPDKSGLREGYRDLPYLLGRFDLFMEQMASKVKDTPVNQIRRKVLDRCNEASSLSPGVFSLTVPTGGGKTLSSMSFALRHAVAHGKRRVIYVIPYTSIIEQTADIFRGIFGESVIEHHSNLDVSNQDRDTPKTRLAAENWDAPIVVTTSVQFFESLFASKSSRCRKLHNIVESVVVLDEAQLLPPDFLKPILKMIDELRRNYGVTIVLCTATQPAFSPRKTANFQFEGIDNIVEIMDDVPSLYRDLKRVDVHVPTDLNRPCSWEEVARSLCQHESVLCIVNRRDDARSLWELMPDGTYHLSALMCGAHRSRKIDEIRKRLKDGLPTRVISTQLIEAGVDVDFAVVWRALAGFDSIAQAAGRCNREGLLPRGEVHVFIPPSEAPPGHLRQAARIGHELFSSGLIDPLLPDSFHAYFRKFYWMQGDRLDAKGIMFDLNNDSEMRIGFRSAAAKFRMIDESYSPVIVRYGNEREIEFLLKNGPDRWLLRKLQRYTVNLPSRVHGKLLDSESISEVHPGIFVQMQDGFYDEQVGFKY